MIESALFKGSVYQVLTSDFSAWGSSSFNAEETRGSPSCLIGPGKKIGLGLCALGPPIFLANTLPTPPPFIQCLLFCALIPILPLSC